MTVLIQNAHILTMDHRREIVGGALLVREGKIAFVGEERDLPAQTKADRVIDARGGVVMPGFINAHTHLAMTLLRGYGSDLNLQDWLFQKIFPAEDRLLPGDCGAAGDLGIAEMLLGGTTAFLDMYMFMEETAEAVKRSGIRAVLSRGLTAGDAFEEKLAEAVRLHTDWHDTCDGRIRVMLCVHAEYTNNEQTVRRIAEEAKKLGVGIHVHVSETDSETKGCLERHGVTPAQWLDSLGVFDGPAVAAHCVWLTPQDEELFARKGVSVVHNPGSNMKLASGVCPVQELLNRGVNVALGTDGASSNNTLNMQKEVYLAALLGKLSALDPTAVDAYTALEMATVRGAKALGIDDVCGVLREGMDADLILFDTCAPWWSPVSDAAAQVVYAASQEDIRLTMVRGEILMEDRVVKTVNVAAAKAAVEHAVEHLYE
ncbi:MAG: amidohydrolase [Eubacteriales bacterium]|nr:amidohydrolase [Eubacteriales bacterium]